jgi:mannose-6-phosphate isomerase-like protein (cupin superfamily)
LTSLSRQPESFQRDGFIGPVPLLTRAQCALVLHHFRRGDPPAPLKWEKGGAASDCLLFDLATRPVLLARLRLLLGDDLLLWGASLLIREPTQIHPWHSDIESSASDGGFVSVWIGIENTSRESALQLIKSSHAFGRTIQQVAHEHEVRRVEASAATVLDWAREIAPSAEFVQPSINDGDALFFDGRLWHGSDNTSARTRTALLFQYAAAGKPVRMPNWNQLEWPFRYKHSRVPVLVVSGSDSTRTNYLVPSPTPAESTLTTQFQSLNLPLPEESVRPWRWRQLFAGATPNVSRMNAHVSVLSPGHSPHPLHAHDEEEILIVLEGQAEIIIAQNENAGDARHEQLGAGSFVYYPAFQYHTIRNATAAPITYLMFKWSGPPRETETPLETALSRRECIGAIANRPFATQLVLEGPTHYLRKLHAHLTELQADAGYSSHTDAHDVAIVVLAGTVETMGRRVEPPGLVYFPAGEMHDMKNLGPGTIRYLVFEFHGPSNGEVTTSLSLARRGSPWRAWWNRVYSRFRRKVATTYLGQKLRRIYRQDRRIFRRT